jgi:hypothetical protein
MWVELSWKNIDLLSAKRASEFGLGQWQTSGWIPCNYHSAVLLLLVDILSVDTVNTKRPHAALHVEWGSASRESELFAADGTSWRLNSRNSIKKKDGEFKFSIAYSSLGSSFFFCCLKPSFCCWGFLLFLSLPDINALQK